MTKEEAKSCIGTIEMLQRLAYNIHGVMDVIDADNCKKIIKALEQEPCDDCISRQAVVYYIKAHIHEIITESGIDKNEHTNRVLRAIINGAETMPSVNPQRWIPVSERLPKAGEYIGGVAKYYLVQNEYGDMLVARYTHSEYWEEIYRLKPISDEIVAWMPLPEPYKAESEEEE